VFLHVFFINAANGVVTVQRFCMLGTQTIAFTTADLRAGESGYALMVAVNAAGCPISFNYLTGAALVKTNQGLTGGAQFEATLEALAVAAIASAPATCTTTATLAFDGVKYNRLPRALMAEHLPSQAEGNTSLLILTRLGGDLTAPVGALGTVEGALNLSNNTNANFTLTQASPQFCNVLTAALANVPAGQSAWLECWTQSDFPLIGALLNFHPSAVNCVFNEPCNPPPQPNAFKGGRNLRALTLTTTATYRIPVGAVTCP
jgi:hypothetical protein